MKPHKEAKKYAKMLLSAVGIEEAPKALAELAAIDGLMTGSRDFRNLLLNPVFSQAEKVKILTQVSAKAGLSEKTVKFIAHLSESGLIAALSDVLRIARELYLEKKKRARATVMTPVEIGKAHEERLKASLAKVIAREVDIEFVHDPSLLGGVVVQVGSTMYDSSIKGQLRLLKDELIKG